MGSKSKEQSKVQIEVKILGGRIVDTKLESRNGIDVGIVKGYIATWDVDRGGWDGVKDQFVMGAFRESLQDHRDRDNRPVRLKNKHDDLIGGFPIESVREDDRGLFGIGEINLETQQGREVFSLARQGMLTDFSIGFSVEDSETNFDQDRDAHVRKISKAIVWEGSIVDEPMNPSANITDVKTWGVRDIEKALMAGSKLSKAAAGKAIQIIKACPDSQFIDKEVLKFFIMLATKGEHETLASESINLETVVKALASSISGGCANKELDIMGVYNLAQSMLRTKETEYTQKNFTSVLSGIDTLTGDISNNRCK